MLVRGPTIFPQFRQVALCVNGVSHAEALDRRHHCRKLHRRSIATYARGADRDRRSASCGRAIAASQRSWKTAARRCDTRLCAWFARGAAAGAAAGPRPNSRCTAEENAAGRRRLAQRSGALAVCRGAFAARSRGERGLRRISRTPSRPAGAAGGDRGSRAAAGRRASRPPAAPADFVQPGFATAPENELDADWFGRVQLDFGRNAVVLPDASEIVGVEVTIAASADMPPDRGASARRGRCCARR